MKPSLAIVKIILIVTIIISIGTVLGTTVYLALLKRSPAISVQPQLTPTATPTPEPLITPIPTATPTPTSGALIIPDTTNPALNIYQNTKYGFEFKYKNNWQAIENNNSVEFKPISKDKPEEISISVNMITNRPENYTIAGWLSQNGNESAPCSLVKKIGEIKWCVLNTERFEAVRVDDYAVTKNGIDYDVNFRVAYGRQKMDYYIPDQELSEEINILNQILSTFRFSETAK